MPNELSFYDQLIERMKEKGLKDEEIFSKIKELEPLVNEYEKMPRKDPKTNEFYNSKIFALSKIIFLANPQNRLEEQYDCLISTLGESPHPLVLSILAIRPKEKVFLFHTKETEEFINYVAEQSKLSYTKCVPILVDGSDVAELYRKMKELYLDLKDKKIAIDITGGKKTMASGAALAGFMMNADIFYIDNYGYDSDLRCPKPGAEFLCKLKNPFEIFGDIELRSAIRLFNDYNYARAADILRNLGSRVSDNRIIGLIRLLAKAYDYWDELKFGDSLKCMEEVINCIQRYGSDGSKFIFQSYIENLKCQNRILSILNDMKSKTDKDNITEEILKDREMVKTLVFFLYTNSERRQHQGKYDTSALIMYRILELIMQRRLLLHNIDPDEPNYENLGIDDLLEKLNKKKSEIGIKDVNVQLPSKIGLLDGYIILSIINDKVSVDPGWLKDSTSERNKSILAHGFRPIAEDNLEKIRKVTDKIIKLFCEDENIDFKNEINYFKFIKLPENESLYSFSR